MTRKNNIDKPKKNMTEKQLANLIPFSSKTEKDREHARRCSKLGQKKKEELKKTKITRRESPDIIFDELCGTREELRQLISQMSVKDKISLIIRLLPPDTLETINKNLNFDSNVDEKTINSVIDKLKNF